MLTLQQRESFHMLACAIHDRRVAGAVARARHTQRLMLHAPQAEAAVLKFKEAALPSESRSSNQAAAAASCAVVCCATNGFGRQPLAAAAVQTRHRDCCIIVAAGRLAATMFHNNANCLTSHRCTLFTSNRVPCGSHALLCSRLRTHVVGARCRSLRRRRRCSGS
jgi:hypothetical protein